MRLNSFGGAAGLKEYMQPEWAVLVAYGAKGETYVIRSLTTHCARRATFMHYPHMLNVKQ